MDVRERRKVLERYNTENCIGIISNTTEEKKYDVVNINRCGLLLRGNSTCEGKNLLTLLKKGNEILIEKIPCTLKSHPERKNDKTNQEHVVAIFDKELEQPQIARLNDVVWATEKNNPRLWHLMITDRQEIKEEMYRIERCRSDIFLAVMTAIFAAVVAIGCLVVKDNIKQGAFAVASIVTFLMFLLGAYTTLEKANALNTRQGFLANLNEYIRLGRMPISYQGWSKIKYYFRDCGIMMRLKRCPVKYPKKLIEQNQTNSRENELVSDRSRHACRLKAKKSAKELNLSKKFLPGINDSFMSLCSYIYGGLYGFSIVVFSFLTVYAIEMSLKTLINDKTFQISIQNQIWFYIYFLSGALISILFLMKFRKYVFKEGFYISIALLFVSLFMQTKINIDNYFLFGCLLASLTGSFTGAIGGHLLNSLYILRKGIRSPETYYFAWKNAITDCCATTDIIDSETIYTPTGTFDRFIYNIESFLYGR